MELLRDLRASAPAVVAKAVIVGVFLLSVYNLVSFSESTDAAVNRSFSAQADVNLYTLVDTLTDPGAFSDFRESPEQLDSLGAFYTALDRSDELQYLSAFDQHLPVREFRGGDVFDAGYGTTGVRGTYVDSMSGLEVRDVKSLQLNENTFDFYNLEVATGEAPDWDAVDYGSGRVPVLLGSSYEGVYELGDTVQGSLYFRELTFVVSGFLEPAASMFYKNDLNFYLDSYVVVPYPPVLDGLTEKDQFFAGILYFAMVNADVAAGKELSPDDVVDQISAVSRSTGFSDWSLLGVPTYLLQFTLAKRVVQDNHALLVSIEAMLAVAVLGAVVAINTHMNRQRRRRDLVRWTLGHDHATLAADRARSWLVETLLVLAAVVTGFAVLPNASSAAMSTTLIALGVLALLDVAHQQQLLGRLLADPTRRDA